MSSKTKKAAPRTRTKAKAKRAKVEVVESPPALITRETRAVLKSVEEMVEGIEGVNDRTLLSLLRDSVRQAGECSRRAVSAGGLALVHAWGCGALLNAAKRRHGRGAFGEWRDRHVVPAMMSERTSQRYMHLAASFPEPRAMLEWAPGLWQAYIACGILPEPEAGGSGEGGEAASRFKSLLSSLGSLQRNIRLLAESRERLGQADKQQLLELRRELDRFFDEILG
jgi:hypothetical protein